MVLSVSKMDNLTKVQQNSWSIMTLSILNSSLITTEHALTILNQQVANISTNDSKIMSNKSIHITFMTIVTIMIHLWWEKRKNSILKVVYWKTLLKMANSKRIKTSMAHHACTLMACLNISTPTLSNITVWMLANGEDHATTNKSQTSTQ